MVEREVSVVYRINYAHFGKLSPVCGVKQDNSESKNDVCGERQDCRDFAFFSSDSLSNATQTWEKKPPIQNTCYVINIGY